MQVPIPDPVPVQPSEIEIVRAEFASERLEMEQKYLRLQETADRAESNARIQEHKAQKMVDVCAKAKDETENLYIANKKLWSRIETLGLDVSLGTNEEKVNLPKENPITGKHKHPKLRRKLATGRVSILSSLKSCLSAARVGHYGRGRPSIEKYIARKCKRKRQPYKRPFRY